MQRYTYDLLGQVVHRTNSLVGDEEYGYDALKQLAKEGKRDYDCDGFGNPRSADVNELNQLLSTESVNLSYDVNGNTTCKNRTTYTYDSLGRLIKIVDPEGNAVSYSYDPLSRLLTKTTSNNTLYYLYDGECEIGTQDELKVVGLGIAGDIGAAIAIEIRGAVYAPLHDLSGNIIALISHEGELVERYPGSAFGEETSGTKLSSWRFSSKRHEEGLVFFGYRFYDPETHRWLTPDPAGFADSVNLYLYVRSAPLNRLDRFGLLSEEPGRGRDNFLVYPIVPIFYPGCDNVFGLKGTLQGSLADLLIAFQRAHELQFNPEKFDPSIIANLEAQLNEKGSKLHTMVNGMCCPIEQAAKNCSTFVENNPNAVVVSLHLPPERSIVGEIITVIHQFLTANFPKLVRPSLVVRQLSEFLAGITNTLHERNQNDLIHHTAHSKGGLTTIAAISIMSYEQQSLIAKKMLYTGIAPAMAMRDRHVLNANNIYSSHDYVTKKFGAMHKNQPGYNVTIVPCLVPLDQLDWFKGDHDFTSPTYLNNARRRIMDVEKKYANYQFSNR